jgi:hypothetical protein
MATGCRSAMIPHLTCLAQRGCQYAGAEFAVPGNCTGTNWLDYSISGLVRSEGCLLI